MSDIERLDQHLPFQRRRWLLERVGWMLLGAACLASLAGAGGSERVLRAAAIYGFLLVVLQLAGRRTLGQLTVFDFVLLLIISETVQPALTRDDHSLLSAVILVSTLVIIDILLSLMKLRSPRLERWIEGVPLIVVRDGASIADRLHRARLTEDDVMHAARLSHGLENMTQIKYAVLEVDGHISIVPRSGTAAVARADAVKLTI